MNPNKYHSENLTKRIKLLQPILTQNVKGAEIKIYPDPDSVETTAAAEIEPYTSMIIKGQALQVESTLYRIIIRYRSSVDFDTRISYGKKVFIQSVPPINQNQDNKFLILTCKELR